MHIKILLRLMMAGLVVPLFNGCAWESKKWNAEVIDNGIMRLHIVPQIGGRVIQYELGDYGFFWVNQDLVNTAPPDSGVSPEGEWLNYGGDKLWLAPQGWDNDSQWPGPPDGVLDGGKYAYEIIGSESGAKQVRLTSRPDKRSGIQFSRIIKTFDGCTRVSIDATIKNIDTKQRRWGIWAHTQFNAGNRYGKGYNKNYRAYCPMNPESIFPKGYDVLYGLANNTSFKPDYDNNMMRVHYERRVGKIGLDSTAGWVATVDATDGYAFVQRFKFEPGKEYPENSSVEFWHNGLGEFIAWGKVNEPGDDPRENPYNFESEVLSRYAELDPGEKYTYHYEWYAARIPKDSAVLTCNDIGVICEPFVAKSKENLLSLKGKFGVFYSGKLELILLDGDNRRLAILSPKLTVTPLEHIDISVLSQQLQDVEVPHNAEQIVIQIKDDKGDLIGQLAEAKIMIHPGNE